jgi:hypothetical protein
MFQTKIQEWGPRSFIFFEHFRMGEEEGKKLLWVATTALTPNPKNIGYQMLKTSRRNNTT